MKVPCQYPGQLHSFRFHCLGTVDLHLTPVMGHLKLQEACFFFLTFVRVFFFFFISRSTCQVKQYFMDADTMPSKEPAVACALPDWVGQCPVPTSPSCVLPDGWLFLV